MIGRRSFLGALAYMVGGGWWLRPLPVVYGEMDLADHVMGFSTSPPLHPSCRCVMTTTCSYDHSALVLGDVIRLTLGERTALYMLTSTSDHGRKMSLREL